MLFEWADELLNGEISLISFERYCISNSLATLFGIQLTGAHVPLQDYEASNSVTPKMVVLDAGRYQVRSLDYQQNTVYLQLLLWEISLPSCF